ncbi:MAG: serine/threonine protein phosphatase [Oscillospiraceae bacterium]|nr:serine/threonine protein phosphatase [Oscillospiraceae bacterium]
MKFNFKNFKNSRKQKPVFSAVQTVGTRKPEDFPVQLYAYDLFEKIRRTVPIIDASISKMIRLTGSFEIQCSDARQQKYLDNFLKHVPVGLTGQSIYSFLDCYLDSLLVCGNAVGEIVLDKNCSHIAGLWNGNVADIIVKAGSSPMERKYLLKTNNGEILLKHPERILFSALKPPSGGIYGVSLLQGLPAFAEILLRIYECVGQNFDRAGNIRYAVTYKPTSESGDMAYARERAEAIAKEWSAGMQASKYGEIRDFVSVGDIDIKVIGAESEMPLTEIPVRQLLEQMISKLSIPPFLLGLNWSSTERMSTQQADILTSELEYYRRLLEPVIFKIAKTYLQLNGSFSEINIIWDNINLQDEVELAQARLYNAQAEELEKNH